MTGPEPEQPAAGDATGPGQHLDERAGSGRRTRWTGNPTSAPRRVRVTSPRTRAARPRRTTITSEIDAQTTIGEVYMRSLMRTQLRLGLLVLATVGVLLAGLPALFAVIPQLREVELLGLPLPWLLLGVVVHPALITAAWLYCRQAERNEQAFAELVDTEPATENSLRSSAEPSPTPPAAPSTEPPTEPPTAP